MSISSSAVLTELNISVWTANKLDRNATEAVLNSNAASRDSAQVRKNLMAELPFMATENILMAAVVADGVTTIRNAAREPEIVDLCSMLQRMGIETDKFASSTGTMRGLELA